MMALRWRQLGGLLLAMGMLSIPATGGTPETQPDSLSPMVVDYFYSPTCAKCAKVDAMVDALLAKFPGQIVVKKHDITELSSQTLLRKYDFAYRNAQPVPKVYVGKTVLAGVEDIQSQLHSAVKTELANRKQLLECVLSTAPASQIASQPAPPLVEDQQQELVEHFKTFTWFSVIAAGLIDGINPCAFTTIVFLVSMLAFLGKRRSQILRVGAGFVLGVFVTYMLLGVGALLAIKIAAVHLGLSFWLSVAVAGVAFLLAGWSLWDAIRVFLTGRPEAASLGLPEKTVKRIHTLIRSRLTTGGMLIGAFILGVGISLLESVCTGQVYLPMLMLIQQVSGEYRPRALGFLLAYNLAFILPLAAVLTLAIWGVGSQKIASLFRKHMAVVKLLMAILFAFLGVAVLWSL